MTSDVPVDEPDRLHSALADIDALLLDFDGPICSVFAGFPAPVVADQLRQMISDALDQDLPRSVRDSDDPFAVLYYAAERGTDKAIWVEAALRAHETEAVQRADPTPGAHDLIRDWHKRGRQTAIVSNNSTAAVSSYLHLHGLYNYVEYISARSDSNTELLKPSPFLVAQAVKALSIDARRCILAGDSATDILAAQKAGVMSLGYANKPGKKEAFISLGCDLIVTDMKILAGVVADL